MRILQAEYKLQTLMQHEEEIIDSLVSIGAHLFIRSILYVHL